MHQITAASLETDRKSLHTTKGPKSKEVTTSCGTYGKQGHLQKNCKKNTPFCAYCKTPGHLRADCFKLKRKEQAAMSAQPTPVAAVTIAEVTPEDNETSFVLPDNGKNLSIDEALAKVTRLNNNDCSLLTLVDTSNLISFVKPNVYKRFLDHSVECWSLSGFSYKTLNNKPIQVSGSTKMIITLEQLPHLQLAISYKKTA